MYRRRSYNRYPAHRRYYTGGRHYRHRYGRYRSYRKRYYSRSRFIRRGRYHFAGTRL